MYHESDPGQAGYPTLKRLHGKIWPRLRGLPGLADWATRLGGSPHLSCTRDQIKMRDYRQDKTRQDKVLFGVLYSPMLMYIDLIQII